MQGHEFIINGKRDIELTSVALWFALTYLFAVNIDSNEKRYMLVQNYPNRISTIKNCPEYQLRSWAQYALHRQLKQSTNSGGVSIKEQQSFARQLHALSYIKTM